MKINKRKLAKNLNVSVPTLYKKIDEYNKDIETTQELKRFVDYVDRTVKRTETKTTQEKELIELKSNNQLLININQNLTKQIAHLQQENQELIKTIQQLQTNLLSTSIAKKKWWMFWKKDNNGK